MTPEQIDLVRDSFARLDQQRLGTRFYERLFALDPSIRPLFKGDIDLQARKLTDMLSLAVGALDAPEALTPIVEDLGKRHIGYGVQPQQYVKVATALLATLGEELGDSFDAATRTAWTAAYNSLSRVMLRGSAQL